MSGRIGDVEFARNQNGQATFAAQSFAASSSELFEPPQEQPASDARNRLALSAFPPSASESTISGRAHYGEVAPVARDALAPGLRSSGRKPGVDPTAAYLDYMDYAVLNNRKYDAATYLGISAALADNASDTTDKAFQQILARGVTPDAHDDSALVNAYVDYMKTHQSDGNAPTTLHTEAALETALANYLLQRGTIIDPTKEDSTGRILAGLNLDLGEHALGYLAVADKHLYDEQVLTKQSNPGDLAELLKSRQYVQQEIKLIYGQHDIPGAITALKNAYKYHIIEMAHFQVDLARHVRALPVRNPGEIMVAAKGCRDVALLDLAIAEYKAERGDGDGAEIMYKEGVNFLRTAARLDPSNVDIPDLQKASNKIGSEVTDAVKRQHNNWFNNPFGV